MKKQLVAASSALALLLSPSVLADTTKLNKTTKSKIVGGAPAAEGDWPWMSALVYTFNDLDTSLTVAGTDYSTQAFSYSPSGQATGAIVDCGIGDDVCADATDKICLIERGEINFSVKAENCAAGGGIGVIIYNNVEGQINGTLGEEFAGKIPVVAITQEDGQTLLGQVGESATVFVASEEKLVQDSTCGASFLGDRFVLTASHCVDGAAGDGILVNVGEYDLADGAENAIRSKNIYMHADYNADSLNFDIAIIELETAVDAPAVALADAATTDMLTGMNSAATVMGWGGRAGYLPGEGPTSDFPTILHQVDLQLFSNQECKNIMAEAESERRGTEVLASDINVTAQMICAGTLTGGKGSCQGDSGGPLVVNTSEGWQQVGIVSWGIGCAAQGYPGVYARVGEFSNWIDAISNGIAITQNHNFGIIAVGGEQTSALTLTNNHSETTNLTVSVNGDSGFSVDASACASLAAGQSCDVTVSFSPLNGGEQAAYIEVTADNANIKTSRAKVTGQAVESAPTLAALFTANDAVTWFSGGALPWQANTIGAGVRSGEITHLQDSILLAQVVGEGKLTFSWSVSSEENVDDPNSPYDALYLFVNGTLIDFISGDVAFTSYEVDLADGTNNIAWIYSKDPAESSLDDAAYLKDVVFTAKTTTTPTTPVVTPPTNNNARSGGGGGSMPWISVVALFAFGLVRRNR